MTPHAARPIPPAAGTCPRRRRGLLAAALLAGAGLSAAWAADPAPAPLPVLSPGAKPVRVGFICPLSGGSGDFGNSARLGAELALKEINEVGGFLGRPIELVVRDDKATPDLGRAAAEELVRKEPVAFTLGYCNTGVAMKSLDVFQEQQHVLVVPVATGTAITAKYPAKDSYIFRTSPRDQIQAAFLVEEVVVRRGLKKIALFADTTGYGEGGLNDLKRFLAEKGVEAVQISRFDLGVSSLANELREAQAAGAEAVIAYSVGPELAVLNASRAAAKYTGLVLGPWPMSFRTVWDKSGGAAEGAMTVQSIVPDLNNERRMSFIARLKRHAGDTPIASLMAAAQTYDALHLTMRAYFQARGESGPALKKALENLQRAYTGVVTTHAKPFSDEDHDAFSGNMIWLAQWKKGQLAYVYPDDARKAAVIQRKQK
ncbi:ABC transporter substrate-binding protein [Ideonella livida]|uniref:ABC transporter substrate-binding protein n=1 Tax=Ideonella livida TaxID=2707176 RepID=A0A7C9PKA3_9BURK|nr:ABC transporter substrate-binding protein [Ideonella livida]NDY93094.1 ABC transporter substrate-binding protein [Ideonella livida]